MILKFFKKIISGTLILSILSSGLLASSTFPKKAEAQWAVFDAPLTVQGTLTAASTAVQSGLSYALNYKELALDTIAYMIAKQILRQLTSSVVNWINSGFEGSPSFVTDPGGFFLDVGDQILGDFIKGGELGFLCSPFSIDLRLALAFKYRPFKRQVSCTLSDVIRNSKNAGENASINGFTAGDFAQGGMPAFVSMTTEPQNNIVGAYVEANSEMSLRIANQEVLRRDELSQGKGFLSFKNCRQHRVISDQEANELTKENNALQARGDTSSAKFNDNASRLTTYYEASSGEKTMEQCEVETPGSVIAGTLETSLGSPVRELELADEFNEIINALFAQLVQQVLIGGLRSASGKGASDPEAYITQLQQEQVANNPQLTEIKNKIFESIDGFIEKALQLKTVKDGSLEATVDVKNKLDNVKSCFTAKLAEQRIPALNASQVSYATQKIAQADTIINTRVAPTSARLLTEAGTMSQTVTNLQNIKRVVTNATTVNEVSPAAQQYSTLLPDLATYPKKIVDAQAEQTQVRADMAVVSAEASQRLQACQLFPNVLSY